MSSLLQDVLCCPIDRSPVTIDATRVACRHGHEFPCVHGLPVMLHPEMPPTHTRIFNATRAEAREALNPMTTDEATRYAATMLHNTCGQFYRNWRPAVDRLPIPQLPIAAAGGRFLDVGCGWGRWCISAAEKGYTVVGIDPLLDSVRAAQSLTRHLGDRAAFVVGDARCLPFTSSAFDVVHSYAVFLHLAQRDTAKGVEEIGRVLRAGGDAWVQLPNARGVRNLIARLSRGFRDSEDPGDFSTRYWTRREMRTLFERYVGPPSLVAEGFGYTSAGGIPQGGLGALPWMARPALAISSALAALSASLPPLAACADSIYVHSVKTS